MEETAFRSPREPLVPPGGIDCHVRDMTATVSADATLGEFQRELAGHQQWVPIDGDSTQSVGTLASTDSTGPLRLGYGAWRDLLLGVQFLNGRGRLVTAGGRTVKNVAGYDLTKFMVGQRGIFGRLVTLTMRTYRRPQGAILARHAPDPSVVNKLIPTSLKPHWVVLTGDALLCGYLGDRPSLDFYRNAIGQAGVIERIERTLDEDIAHRTDLWAKDGPVTFRASVPPASLAEFAKNIATPDWSADAAFGVVIGACTDKQLTSSLRDSAAALGGTLRTYQGLYGQPLELSTNPGERQIIERLKDAFDPDVTLQPLPWQHS
jgi:hypothetical protein